MASRLVARLRACSRLSSCRGARAATDWAALRQWRARGPFPLISRASATEAGNERRYMKSHEWACLDGGVATFGISNYAQEKLGDIVFVELPEVGTKLSRGDMVAVLESVKAAADLYAPVSGEVVEVNEALDKDPETINGDPFGKGWIAKLKVTEESGYEALMTEQAYLKMLEEEAD